jgi:hypothetical protein
MDNGGASNKVGEDLYLLWRRETSANARGNKEGNRSWCSKGSRGEGYKNVAKGIFDPKKKWGMEKNPGLYPREWLFAGQEVQNGRPQDVSQVAERRYVVGEHRHKGCVSPYMCTTRTRQIFEFPVQSSFLSIPGNALWSEDGPKGFLEDNAQVYSDNSTSLEGRCDSIYRRYLDRPCKQRVLNKVYPGDCSVPAKVRMVAERGKVGVGTETGIPFFRMVMEHNQDGGVFEQRPSESVKTGSGEMDSLFQTRKGGSNKSFGIVNREIVSCTPSVQDGEPVLGRVKPSKKCSSQTDIVGRTSENERISIDRLGMVESQSEEEHTIVTEADGGPSGTLDRRLSFRLGSTFEIQKPQQRYRRSSRMRFLEKQLEFKQAGVGRSIESPTILQEDGGVVGNTTYITSFRQLNNRLQSEQMGGSEVIDSTNERGLQLSPTAALDVVCDTCKRGGQWKSGQSITSQSSGRLCLGSEGGGFASNGMEHSIVVRFIRFRYKSQTYTVLLPIRKRWSVYGQRCLFYPMVQCGTTISTSADTSATEMSGKNSEGTCESSSSSTPLVRSVMVKTIKVDDTKSKGPGRVFSGTYAGKIDDKISGQFTTRKDSGLPSGRINDKGQQLVLGLLGRNHLTETTEWFFKSIESTTLRNYRRGFTLFASLMEEEGLSVMEITDSDSALAVLVRVLRLAFQKKCKLSAVRTMKTAMVRVFNMMYNVNFAQAPTLKMALRYYVLGNLPKKEPVRLEWNIMQLFSYLRGLQPFRKMGFEELTGVTATLCIALTALRFTELMKLWVFDSEPEYDKGFWKLWTHVKNHDCVEPVLIHVVKEEHLNLVEALCELKDRVNSWYIGQNQVCETLWHKLVGSSLFPLKYEELRLAVRNVLGKAGICDNRPYHIKHAAMTWLNSRGASASELANFARHKHGSMTAYQNYISNDGGKKSVACLVGEIVK